MDFSQYVKDDALVLSNTIINISELVGFLQENTHITELSLPHCRIGDGCAKALANCNLRNLTKLDLSYNRIGDGGAVALADGGFTNLTKLTLGGNDFGERGEEVLKHNLGGSISLDLLFLSTVDMRAKLHYATKDLGEMIAREVGFVQAVDQQQESDAQAAVNDQPGPSSELSEVPLISRSQSLNSLHSSDSDISRSQFR